MKRELVRKQRTADETIDVRIEKIVPNGFGLAFAEDRTIFVPLAVTGDRLRVKIYQVKGNVAFAEIVEVLEPGADRIEPPCVYFGRCGGCDFQQMNYEAQLRSKIAIVRDCLTRIGKIEYEREIPIAASPKPFEYRARAMWRADAGRKKLGYFQRNTNNVIDVERCPILVPELNETLGELRENIAWENLSTKPVAIEASSGSQKVSVFSAEIIEPTEEIFFEALGERFFYSARSFFQGNPFLIEELMQLAIGGAEGTRALDLYCGVGLFTLPLARRFDSVTGVEASRQAIEFAERSAEFARIENAEFHSVPVKDFLLENDLSGVDFVLLDPPRAGTEKIVIERVIELGAPHISYVSCEPSVLARDLKRLTAAGYAIESITAVDLFPQTHHVETVVRLKKD